MYQMVKNMIINRKLIYMCTVDSIYALDFNKKLLLKDKWNIVFDMLPNNTCIVYVLDIN